MSDTEKQRLYQQQYNTYQDTLNALSDKITQIRADLSEHQIVMDTLGKAPKDRKCFQMVGGVLLEKSAGDLVPILTEKCSGMTNALDNLSKELVKTHQELEDWKKKTGVKIVRTD